MIYKTHIVFAITPICAFETIFDYLVLKDEIILYLFITIGSLLPDLDEEESYIGKRLNFVSIVLKLFGVIHRGATHRFISLILFALAIFILQKQIIIDDFTKLAVYGLFIGYSLHLLGDMLTKGGIENFYYPISSIKAVLLPRNLRFYTNSKQELLVYYLLVGFLVTTIFLRLVYLSY